MKIIKASVGFVNIPNGNQILSTIERAGRTCYKSEDKITEESAPKFVKMLIERGHEAMIEHCSISAKFICDRGVSHEIVRHRVASYAQESTRYANYSKNKFGNEITVVEPLFWKKGHPCYDAWLGVCRTAEREYLHMIKLGAKPEEARSILPNSLKTEIIVTMNLRAWRHFFKLRCAKDAHPQMREVAIMALKMFQSAVPVVFDDITADDEPAAAEDVILLVN